MRTDHPRHREPRTPPGARLDRAKSTFSREAINRVKQHSVFHALSMKTIIWERPIKPIGLQSLSINKGNAVK
jgi:hypothetical protein